MDKKYTVEKICAWCKKVLGEQESQMPYPTHGICIQCARKHFEEEER